MTKINRIVSGVAALAIVTLAACASGPVRATANTSNAGLRELTTMMTGAFSSSRQAAADPQNFRDVHLHMSPIWIDRADGPWLYVEQAMATTLDKPYRQRIYQLRANPDNSYTSAVYKLPGDATDSVLSFAGAWNNPSLLNGLTPEQLTPLTGCDIILRRLADGSFTGSTSGSDCASNRQGARYTTSEVMITPTMLTSWDRGFDEQHQQVWGATAGGYRFEKLVSQ